MGTRRVCQGHSPGGALGGAGNGPPWLAVPSSPSLSTGRGELAVRAGAVPPPGPTHRLPPEP